MPAVAFGTLRAAGGFFRCAGNVSNSTTSTRKTRAIASTRPILTSELPRSRAAIVGTSTLSRRARTSTGQPRVARRRWTFLASTRRRERSDFISSVAG